MPSQTNEQALEIAIQKHLTGTTVEALKSGSVVDETPGYAQHLRFRVGLPADFDAGFALDTSFFWQFLETTQKDELDKLKKYNPADWQRKIVERFDRLVKKHGVLHLLKRGLSVDDAHLTLFYPAPLASSSQRVHDNFNANIFSCMRQVAYSQAS